jgi:hypothetical protein
MFPSQFFGSRSLYHRSRGFPNAATGEIAFARTISSVKGSVQAILPATPLANRAIQLFGLFRVFGEETSGEQDNQAHRQP